jgi:arylsulfatase A-like enzyme
MDVAPSLLAVAGVPVPAGVTFDGQDMSVAMTGAGAEPRTTPVMWLRPPGRGGRERQTPGELAIRDGDWKLLVANDGSQPELFDVVKDPNEQTNLADKNPDVVKRLADAVVAWDRSIEAAASSAAPAARGKK